MTSSKADVARRILVVDDDDSSREVLAQLLKRAGYLVECARDGRDALAKLDANRPDLLITDAMMPGTNGFELIAQLRQRTGLADMPIILVSAIDDETRRVGGLDLGADDYLPKPLNIDETLARVRLHLRHASRRSEILAQSTRDELTGVLNRAGILELLERERERSRRDGAPLTLFVVDVDDFKSINDQFGHSAGDRALIYIAEQLTKAVRTNDRVGRIGGDEFLIVAPNTGEEAAEVLLQRLRRADGKTADLGVEAPVELSWSVGGAADDSTIGEETLFDRADQAMYADKRRRARRR